MGNVPDVLIGLFDSEESVPMKALYHFEYIGDVPLPGDAYTYETYGDFLAHYGVMGMRWGVRKPGTRGGTLPSNRKKGSVVKKTSSGGNSDKKAAKDGENKKTSSGGNSDKKAAKDGENKTVSSTKKAPSKKPDTVSLTTMSDAELQQRLNRMRLEQQFLDMTKVPPKTKSRGRQTVESILWDTTKSVGTAYAQHLALQQIHRFDPTFRPTSSKKK